jgi:hypothetical protein
VEPAGEVPVSVAEEVSDDVKGFLEPTDAVVVGVSEGPVFVGMGAAT